MKNIETIAQCQTRLVIEKSEIQSPSELSIDVINHLADEINRIIKLNPDGQTSDASRNFFWIKALKKMKSTSYNFNLLTLILLISCIILNLKLLLLRTVCLLHPICSKAFFSAYIWEELSKWTTNVFGIPCSSTRNL